MLMRFDKPKALGYGCEKMATALFRILRSCRTRSSSRLRWRSSSCLRCLMPTADKRLLASPFLLSAPAAQVAVRGAQIFGHLADRFPTGLHQTHCLNLKGFLIRSMFVLHEVGLLFPLFLPILDPLQKRSNYRWPDEARLQAHRLSPRFFAPSSPNSTRIGKWSEAISASAPVTTLHVWRHLARGGEAKM